MIFGSTQCSRAKVLLALDPVLCSCEAQNIDEGAGYLFLAGCHRPPLFQPAPEPPTTGCPASFPASRAPSALRAPARAQVPSLWPGRTRPPWQPFWCHSHHESVQAPHGRLARRWSPLLGARGLGVRPDVGPVQKDHARFHPAGMLLPQFQQALPYAAFGPADERLRGVDPAPKLRRHVSPRRMVPASPIASLRTRTLLPLPLFPYRDRYKS